GPLNIQFGLTAIPILLVSFILGPLWGALCGLLGGIMQAQKYGHMLYIIYTALQGLVAGALARHVRITRRVAPLFALIGGFFLVWWVDILRKSTFTLQDLGTTSFADAPHKFGSNIIWAFPVAGAIGAVFLLGVTWWSVRRELTPYSSLHLALAGCIAAVCYVPYDAFLLHWVQGYPWLPTWFVLSKDLVQDFAAALLCSLLMQNQRVKNAILRET